VAHGNNESAGKKNTRTMKGNPHIKVALCKATWAASKTMNTQFSEMFWRLDSKRRKKKARVALALKMYRILYFMLSNQALYMENLQRIIFCKKRW
jgi:transposase